MYKVNKAIYSVEWSGATTAKNEAMNFLKYCVSPKKFLTPLTFLGTCDFMMESIFVESTLISPPPITYPKYTKHY